MKRPFLVEEIMLAGISGEVRGKLEIDGFTGDIVLLDCESFAFRRADTDVIVSLTAAQRSEASSIVRMTLARQSDLSLSSAPIIASAERFSRAESAGDGERVLSQYLESPQLPSAPMARRKAQ